MAPNNQITAQRGTGDHLCVLVHGLWGNPNHFHYLADALRSRYDNSRLQILITERNAGRNTYDGIETCGERVAWEIENALEESAKDGVDIKKISIVGYSLGGLISRYAIGLLYSKGFFEKIQPVNFTTFATPHLGVRTPFRGFHNHIWNVLGARTISVSGRQLFTIDNFRGTGRPLLSVLADQDSVFYEGLALFQNKSLYANIANDKSCAFYTSAITRCNPFADLSAVTINYLPGYAPNIIDPENPIDPVPQKGEPLPMTNRIGQVGKKIAGLPVIVIYSLVLCIGTMFYLLNAILQNMLSLRRIKLHCSDEHCRGYQALPLLVNELQHAANQVIGGVNQEISPQHLRPSSRGSDASDSTGSQFTDTDDGIKNGVLEPAPTERARIETDNQAANQIAPGNVEVVNGQPMKFPTLALTPAQFKMIENLDTLDFKKFAVWIHNTKHTHAAIIMRKPTEKWKEGKVAVSHWVNEKFKI
ncbi:putative serine esterase-domain-containing protein [Trichophaea hybrida]|nr:putative serine esterase-domain-containing protein [Trichophaea hybrida]